MPTNVLQVSINPVTESDTCLVVVAVFSTVAYVVAYYGFRLTRQPGGTLHIVRGLLTEGDR